MQGLFQTLGAWLRFFQGTFSEKRAFCLLAVPKQKLFLTFSNENIFSKIQGSRLGAEVAPNKVLEQVLPWVFFTFFKLHKWYQIAQRISYKHFSCGQTSCCISVFLLIEFFYMFLFVYSGLGFLILRSPPPPTCPSSKTLGIYNY